MNIGSIGGATTVAHAQAAQRQPEASEVKKSGPDGDGDSDDSRAKAAQANPQPSVNLSGQVTGQVINTSA